MVQITLTLEFCAQPLRLVWLIYEAKVEFERYWGLCILRTQVASWALLLIIAVDINFS